MIRRGKPIRTVAPASALISYEEAKKQCRVDADDESDTIAAYIAAAAQHLDGHSGVLRRALISQTWRCAWSGFPADRLRLPVGDATSVASVVYRDAADAERTLASSAYALHLDAGGSYLAPTVGTEWPETSIRDDAVTVTWVAGYGPDADAVPAPIRQAARLLVAHFFEQRDLVVVGATVASVPMAVDALIAPYRLRSIA